MPQQMDGELLQQAQAGEESAIAALITAMMPAIRKGAAAVAAPGLDFDDAVQEGLIGLFHAVRSYRADKKVPFTAYAAACIANAQQDARRSATRKKHAPLNNSVPLPENSAAPGPEELAIANERCAAVLERTVKIAVTALEKSRAKTIIVICHSANSVSKNCNTHQNPEN